MFSDQTSKIYSWFFKKKCRLPEENKRFKLWWFLLSGDLKTAGLSKNQKLILKFLEIKTEMTTKELAEMVFGKPVEYKSAQYASVSRSLRSLERRGFIKRVQIQLRWRLKSEHWLIAKNRGVFDSLEGKLYDKLLEYCFNKLRDSAAFILKCYWVLWKSGFH